MAKRSSALRRRVLLRGHLPHKGDDGSITSLLALNRRELDNLGVVRIVETKGPTAIIPGAFLSGRVEQRAEYEAIPPSFVARRGNEYVPEAFPGEQALFMNAREKGLVVVSACAHRRYINTVRQAQRITGIEKSHMVIGGFHLTGAKPRSSEAIADMKAIDPVYVVPTHCTGFEAIAAFAREMPGPVILNTAAAYVVA